VAGLSYTRNGPHILRMDAAQTYRYRAIQRVLTAGGLPHSTLAALASPLLPAHRGGFIQRGSATWDRQYVAPGLEGYSVISMSPPASGNTRTLSD